MHQLDLNKRKNTPFSTNASPSRTPISGTDRISSLPDEILHHIMSFLPTKVATGTIVLAKRFKDIWWSFPTIELVEDDHVTCDEIDFHEDYPRTRKTFLDYLRLCYECHNLKFLEKLIIIENEKLNEEDANLFPEIDLFVVAAFRGGSLKEIDLRLSSLDLPPYLVELDHTYYGSFYMVPQILLFTSCWYLKRLNLMGCAFNAEEFGTMVPNINLPFLRKVSLWGCVIPPNFVSRLISGSPQLEVLIVQFCLGVQVIRSSHANLKYLKLACQDSKMVWEIDVPNLRRFKFEGAFWTHSGPGPADESLKSDHIFNAPNLERTTIKYCYVLANTIQKTLTRYKNLKEMVLKDCYMEKVPEFWGDKIEKLVILNCGFGDGGLSIYDSKLPALRSLTVHACKGIRSLIIESKNLEELTLKVLVGLKTWVIYAPNLGTNSCVNLCN